MRSIVDEKSFRLRVEEELRGDGWFVTHLAGMLQSGVPDLWVCHRGVSAWIELKFARLDDSVGSGSGVLAHRFTGPQRRWIRDVAAQSCQALGLVGYTAGAGQLMAALLPFSLLDDKGQVARSVLEREGWPWSVERFSVELTRDNENAAVHRRQSGNAPGEHQIGHGPSK